MLKIFPVLLCLTHKLSLPGLALGGSRRPTKGLDIMHLFFLVTAKLCITFFFFFLNNIFYSFFT